MKRERNSIYQYRKKKENKKRKNKKKFIKRLREHKIIAGWLFEEKSTFIFISRRNNAKPWF